MTGVQTCALPILLSGALGGGVSSGVNALVGEAGLPSAVSNPLASAATAAILGKDPTMAAVSSLLGQAVKSGASGDASAAGALTSSEAQDRQGVADVIKSLKDAGLVSDQATISDLLAQGTKGISQTQAQQGAVLRGLGEQVGTVQSGLENLKDRKSTRLNSSHIPLSRMPSSA